MPKPRARSQRPALVVSNGPTNHPLYGEAPRFARCHRFGMVCPDCNTTIIHDRKTDRFFCGRCNFSQDRETYRETVADIRVTQRRREAIRQARFEKQRELADSKANAAVYYIEFRGAIKIGTSICLISRLAAHPWEWLLALEPGSYELESERHKQFDHLLIRGEWFDDAPELREHIGQVIERSREWKAQFQPFLGEYPVAADNANLTGVANIQV